MATKRARASFRPSATAATTRHGPSRAQLAALLIAVVVVAAGVSIASVLVKPSKARAFNFFYGSMFLNDTSSPVAVDLASGKPTVRLGNATAAVSAKDLTDLDVVPLGGGNTLMLDTRTGEFNMVDPTGFVIKTTTGGVTLPHSLPTSAVASGSSAYLVQRAKQNTYVYLVSAATVASAANAADRNSTARADAEIGAGMRSSASVASANDNLWLLTGTGESRTITKLEVPPQSNAGATLVQNPKGSVTGPAAIESAAAGPNPSSGDVVGVASARSVQVFSPTGDSVTVPVSAGNGVDRILPASNAVGSLAYLYHASSTGWSLVTVPATGPARAGVVPLSPVVPNNAALASPAESNGTSYFIDTTDSGLWQVTGDKVEPIPDAATYPFTEKEKAILTDAQVLARGTRVIFNNPTSSEALVVFSDDSRAPRVLDKRAPIAIDPAGAAALIKAHQKHANKAETTGQGHKNDPDTRKPPAKVPPPGVDNRVDCRTADQVPHVPKLFVDQRAARSIELQWTYPTPDPTDCMPSTFVVNARTVTPGAPQVAAHTVVNHGFGITLGGLYPATQYELSVTAYIHNNAATSPEIPATTGPEGPQAPTGVTATPDSSGNWTVSWTSCGGVAQGCVPSTSWTVIPSFCDNRSGLYANPDKLTITADPTQHSFRTVYPGSDALLGRALCFQVQGTGGPDDTIGDISATTAPAYSWRPPVAGSFHLTASRPPSTTLGAAASTELTLDLGANPVRDVGGVGASVTFLLHGPAGTQTRTVTVDGHSQRITASFPGVKAGRQYTAQATVSAPRHPEASVTVNGGTVSTRANWPQLGLTAQCTPTDPNVHLSCNLSVGITGLSSATADGERFTLSGDSYLRCGETYQYLHRVDFDPAVSTITSHIDLLSALHGVCTVSIQLIEGVHQADPPLFGGITSPVVTQSVDLGQPTTLDATAGDFAVSFSNTDGSSVDVAYTGRFAHDDVAKIAPNWHEQIYAPNGTQCGGDSAGQGGQPEVFVDIKPFDCILDQGNQTGWTITISYTDAGTSTQHVFDHLPIPGTPPGYIPQCTASQANFDAHWSGTYDNPSVSLNFAQNGAVLDGCSNWSYQVNRAGSPDPCAAVSAPVSQLPMAIGLPPQPPAGTNNCDIETSQWNVGISFRSARTGDHTVFVPVTGTAPPPPTTPPPTTPPPTTPPPTTPPPTTPPPSSPTDSSSASDTPTTSSTTEQQAGAA